MSTQTDRDHSGTSFIASRAKFEDPIERELATSLKEIRRLDCTNFRNILYHDGYLNSAEFDEIALTTSPATKWDILVRAIRGQGPEAIKRLLDLYKELKRIAEEKYSATQDPERRKEIKEILGQVMSGSTPQRASSLELAHSNSTGSQDSLTPAWTPALEKIFNDLLKQLQGQQNSSRQNSNLIVKVVAKTVTEVSVQAESKEDDSESDRSAGKAEGHVQMSQHCPDQFADSKQPYKFTSHRSKMTGDGRQQLEDVRGTVAARSKTYIIHSDKEKLTSALVGPCKDEPYSHEHECLEYEESSQTIVSGRDSCVLQGEGDDAQNKASDLHTASAQPKESSTTSVDACAFTRQSLQSPSSSQESMSPEQSQPASPLLQRLTASSESSEHFTAPPKDSVHDHHHSLHKEGSREQDCVSHSATDDGTDMLLSDAQQGHQAELKSEQESTPPADAKAYSQMVTRQQRTDFSNQKQKDEQCLSDFQKLKADLTRCTGGAIPDEGLFDRIVNNIREVDKEVFEELCQEFSQKLDHCIEKFQQSNTGESWQECKDEERSTLHVSGSDQRRKDDIDGVGAYADNRPASLSVPDSTSVLTMQNMGISESSSNSQLRIATGMKTLHNHGKSHKCSIPRPEPKRQDDSEWLKECNAHLSVKFFDTKIAMLVGVKYTIEDIGHLPIFDDDKNWQLKFAYLEEEKRKVYATCAARTCSPYNELSVSRIPEPPVHCSCIVYVTPCQREGEPSRYHNCSFKTLELEYEGTT